MLDTSYHRRRVARQMQDPVYRAAYEQATLVPDLKRAVGVQGPSGVQDRPTRPVLDANGPQGPNGVQGDRSLCEIQTADHRSLMIASETAALWAQTQAFIVAGDIEGLAAAMRRDAEGLAEELAARTHSAEALDESKI